MFLQAWRSWVRGGVLTSLFVGVLTAALAAGGTDASGGGGVRVVAPGVPAEVLPPVALRGFGTVAGTAWRFSPSSSLLCIHCEDAAKAQLTQAKYLSDQQVLPGVQAVTVAGVAALRVAGQGVLAAGRSGPEVFILTAASEAELTALLTARLQGDTRSLVFTPEVEVPMWLDRWDKYGFRFYDSYPFQMQPGVKDYDLASKFEFADQQGKAGLLYWVSPFTVDSGEEMMNNTGFEWAVAAAERRGLPVGLQLGYAPETWLANRYRDETAQKMPQYCGDRYNGPGAAQEACPGFISWNAVTARLVMMRQMQDIVRHLSGHANVTSWLEPHSELAHAGDLFMDYGPVADEGYRTFLKQKYGEVRVVSQRWTGSPQALKSWNDVHVPELASFLGWGPDALDLAGAWRVGHPEVPAGQDLQKYLPPDEMFRVDFDDSQWPELLTPGHDRSLLIPHTPAVYRRTVPVPAAWRQAHPRVWLYVWDLSRRPAWPLKAVLNGVDLGLRHTGSMDWQAYEVTSTLQDGDNRLALYLCDGFFGYRVYLSPHPPVQYPDLGPDMNARWVDFNDWNTWSKAHAVGWSMGAIRQVDPNRNFSLASPDEHAADIRELAVKYGGEFHNTGYMSGFWADLLPMLMRGADLPCSLEPGSAAPTLESFKTFMGLNATEGIQGIDYFMNIGDIMWAPEIRPYFEQHRNEIMLTGKVHPPRAELAFLQSTRIQSLVGFPWGKDPNVNLGSGYWVFTAANLLKSEYPRDAVTEYDFLNGNAKHYRMIIDQNTSIMDAATVSSIERYVRQGGIFVTFVQTGRHTPEGKDAWPIKTLTGYEVTGIDPQRADGVVVTWRGVHPAPDQDIFPAQDWAAEVKGNGLTLKKVAPECQDLLLWADGTVAAGLRPLGQGFVVNLGVKFAHDRYWSGNPEQTARMVKDLLRHFGLQPLPFTLEGVTIRPFADSTPGNVPPSSEHAGAFVARYYVSNNGLYDIWTLWNSGKDPAHINLVFAAEKQPETCLEVRNWQPVPVQHRDGRVLLADLAFEPAETRIFVTPRGALAQAPTNWFALQRGWWRGTAQPQDLPALPAGKPRFALDLTDDWAFHPASSLEETATLLAAGVDTKTWTRMTLGIWNIPDNREVKHAVFRKQFTVPANWNQGRVKMWFDTSGGDYLVGCTMGHFYLDGKAVPIGHGGLEGDFTPGSTHEIMLDLHSTGSVSGVVGRVWLSYVPVPQAVQDLAGEWQGTKDFWRYDQRVTVPGPWGDLRAARRTVVIPREQAQRNVLLHAEGVFSGLMINGKLVTKSTGHPYSGELDLTITPWVKFGQENEIEIIGGGKTAQNVSLRFYDRKVYP